MPARPGSQVYFDTMQTIQASSFGVTPSSTDVSSALNALTEHIEQLGGNCVVEFDPGSYTIDKRIAVHYGDSDESGRKGRDQHAIVLRGVDNVFLAMDGTRWDILGGYTTHYEQPSVLGGTQWLYPPGFLFLKDCNWCGAWGFTADGGSESIERGQNEHGGFHTELGNHGLAFLGSSHCFAHNFTVQNFTCDGVVADNYPGRVARFQQAVDCHIQDFRVDGCMRNGITVADARGFRASNGRVENTGTSASYMGHSPICGIDVEADQVPDPNDPNKPDLWAGGHVFTDIHVEGPDAMRTFVAYWQKNRGVTIEDCTFIGSPNESGMAFYLFCPDAIMRRSYVRSRLPIVGAHDDFHTLVSECEFEIDFYSHPFGELRIGEPGKTGTVRFTKNVVRALDAYRAAYVFAPNSLISDCVFETTEETNSPWVTSVGSNASGTVLADNRFETTLESAKVALRGQDTGSIIGPGVTSV